MYQIVFFGILVSVATAISRDDSVLVSRQAGNQSCATECQISLNSTLTCVSSPDPFCHCADFLGGAQACSTCLNDTNTTLDGFFNTSYVNFIVGVCNCQIPTCGNLTLAEKSCQVSSPNDPNCACPATAQDGPVCYACLRQHITDPFVLSGIDANLAHCQAVVPSANTSTAPSGSATSSQSSLPTFASVGSEVYGSLRSVQMVVLGLVAVGLLVI